MIIVMGQYRLPADKMKELRPHLAKVIDGSRGELGCITYTLAETVNEPGLIRVAEKWNSWDDLENHFKQPHMAEWRKTAGEAGGVSDRDVAAYEVTSERVL